MLKNFKAAARNEAVLGGCGHAAPRTPIADSETQSPSRFSRTSKASCLWCVRENASPLPATARGWGTRDRSGMKDRSSSFCHQPTKIMDCRLASVPFYSRMTAMPSTSARRQGTAPDAAPKICSLTLMACHWRDLAPHSAVRGSHSIAHGHVYNGFRA
jgi:hypothetical protein